MTYRRRSEDSDQAVVDSSSAEAANPRPPGNLTDRAPASCPKSSRDDSVDEEMHHYTRVQILAQLLHLSDERQRNADTILPGMDHTDGSDEDRLALPEDQYNVFTTDTAQMNGTLHFEPGKQRGDEMSAAVIDLDDMPPTMDLKPTGVGKSEKLKASAEVNEDTSSAEPSDMSTTDLKLTGARRSETSKASAEVNEDTSSAEPLDMPTIDLKSTDVRESEMSKASAEINTDTSSAEPLNIPTEFPAPEPSGGGGRWVNEPYWVCHFCHHLNNPALCPTRCGNCPHHSCAYCSRCN